MSVLKLEWSLGRQLTIAIVTESRKAFKELVHYLAEDDKIGQQSFKLWYLKM